MTQNKHHHDQQDRTHRLPPHDGLPWQSKLAHRYHREIQHQYQRARFPVAVIQLKNHPLTGEVMSSGSPTLPSRQGKRISLR